MRLLLLLEIFRVASAAAAGGECIVVRGERVLAGDLQSQVPALAGLAADTELFRAPAIGVRRVVRRADLPLPPGGEAIPAPLCIERAAQRLTLERVQAALAAALPEGAAVEVADFGRYALPEGELLFPPGGLQGTAGTAPGQLLLWRGRIVAGAQSASVWARVRLRYRVAVAVARRDLRAGEPLNGDTVQIESREVFPFPASPYLRSIPEAGRVIRRRVRQGQALCEGAVAATGATLRGGQPVEAIVESGAVRLKTRAVLEAGAQPGGTVWIRAAGKGARMRGQLEGASTVRVRLPQEGVTP